MLFGLSSINSTISGQLQRIHFPFKWKKQRYAVRPTPYGIVFLAMLMALLIGSTNHNNNLGFLLTFFLVGLVIVSFAHTFTNLQGIAVTQLPVQPVFAGGTAVISLLLQAKTPLRIGITAAVDQFCCESVDLVGARAKKIKISIPTFKRGVLFKESVTIGTDFPLGLIKIQLTLPLSVSCLVYPTAIQSVLITGGSTGTEEDNTAMSPVGDTDFSELSPYRVGDDMRRAHWKSLALGRDLHTVKFEESQTGGAMFSLSRLPGKDVETKLGRLCYMILTAESQGMNYGLELDDQIITQAKGAVHRNACLQALALY